MLWRLSLSQPQPLSAYTAAMLKTPLYRERLRIQCTQPPEPGSLQVFGPLTGASRRNGQCSPHPISFSGWLAQGPSPREVRMCWVPAKSWVQEGLSQLVKNVTTPMPLINVNKIVRVYKKRTSDSLSILNDRKHLESVWHENKHIQWQLEHISFQSVYKGPLPHWPRLASWERRLGYWM